MGSGILTRVFPHSSFPHSELASHKWSLRPESVRLTGREGVDRCDDCEDLLEERGSGNRPATRSGNRSDADESRTTGETDENLVRGHPRSWQRDLSKLSNGQLEAAKSDKTKKV